MEETEPLANPFAESELVGLAAGQALAEAEESGVLADLAAAQEVAEALD